MKILRIRKQDFGIDFELHVGGPDIKSYDSTSTDLKIIAYGFKLTLSSSQRYPSMHPTANTKNNKLLFVKVHKSCSLKQQTQLMGPRLLECRYASPFWWVFFNQLQT